MSREHTPKPGVTWDRELIHYAVYNALDRVPTEKTRELSEQLANPPQPLNREQRRAIQRAQRKRGKQ